MTKTEIAIAYIGGGSRNWAFRLMGDLALEPDLEGELRLYDLDAEAARQNAELGRALYGRPDARGRFAVRAVADRSEALRGADFVVISIEPGATEARYADLEVPAAYGIIQTVGDSTGPGGLLRALRAVPMMENIARAVAAECPRARVINLTNPLSLCTAALYDAEPGIAAHGCCHEVFSVQERMARIVAEERGIPAPDRHEIDMTILGVNHFTMASSVKWRGEELLPVLRSRAEAELQAPGRAGRARVAAVERQEREAWFDCDGLVASEFLLRFGVLGAAGDRHLAEFVPWFLGDEATILSYGVPLTPYEWRLRASRAPRPTLGELRGRELKPSGEELVAQMKALLGMRTLTTNLNLPNRGQWVDAPAGAIVESEAMLGADGISPRPSGSLPPALTSLELRIIAEQTLILEAAKRRDPQLALQALLLDPLVHLSCSRVESMLGEMLTAAAPWLPLWPNV